MKRTHASLGVTALLVAALAVTAEAPATSTTSGTNAKAGTAAPANKGPRKPVTLRGEILDLSCYTARGFSGPAHRDCALRCIASGVCMGIMDSDSMVYMLTLDHARAMAPTTFTTPDPFVLCKQWAGQTVEVVGMAYERRGMHILEVARAKVLPTPAPGTTQ